MSDNKFPILIELRHPTRRVWVPSIEKLPSGEVFTVIKTRPSDFQLSTILNASEAGFFPDDDILQKD